MLFLIADFTEPLTREEWAFAIVLALVGLSVAVVAIRFGGRSDARLRLASEASSVNLWFAIFVGMCGQLLLPPMLMSAMSMPLKSPLTPHQTAILFLLSSVCGFATLLLVHRLQRPHWRMTRSITAAIVPALLGIGSIIPLVIAVNSFVQGIGAAMHLPVPPGHDLLNAFNDPSSSRVDRWFAVFSAVVFAPMFEEMLFRAHLQTALRKLLRRPWIAIAIVSALFGLAHASVWMFAPLFLLAIGLGYVYERTENLYAVVLIHGAFNALMIALDFLWLSPR